MARMYSRKKGKHGSKKPFRKRKPVWVKYEPKEIEQIVVKLAKAGKSSSAIGVELRDSYGIPDIRKVAGKRTKAILKEHDLLPEIPEEFAALIKKEMKLLKHLEKNKKDQPSRRGLILTESKIKRLTKYYKRVGILPPDWTYDREKAKLLIGG